jgi:hypothetical protein
MLLPVDVGSHFILTALISQFNFLWSWSSDSNAEGYDGVCLNCEVAGMEIKPCGFLCIVEKLSGPQKLKRLFRLYKLILFSSACTFSIINTDIPLWIDASHPASWRLVVARCPAVIHLNTVLWEIRVTDLHIMQRKRNTHRHDLHGSVCL